ncbi:gluconate 2-dehydrogenase subunit 3 family protein [Bradyrhizobium japonicum]|uniref:gluconate 2-dehydrogenase subunit 3 family protein n=1 Tax=Bradyrhizobium japonicum TaxID=375 RepID=UPI002714F76A|nr:gluconate 2-dehydrogenase subunit 3 family protein [Bradyrhizobium japonicum]WLB56572.1 gluconate 2-dehydrogenase subunit 3 family protein [Bradyrhizobium japonicum]WLB61534.1 gluconate 2-dehydrogenase subunit 3 family protein [Bradyrhizobium japonicum]
MNDNAHNKFGRRGFLQGVAAVTGALSLSPPSTAGAGHGMPAAGASDFRSLPVPESGYQSLGPDEAGFVEALVNVMCPADSFTPNGVDCGLAIYIDRQLAGGFGKGERLYMHGPWKAGKPEHGYQLPLTPEQFFKAGIAAADEAAQQKLGRGFADLKSEEADTFLQDIAAGKIQDARLPLDSWFNELIYPLFVQACFADPMYGGNVGKVFWRIIGYPGLPAVHADDMVQSRGKPYPAAGHPKSIGDFS